MCRTWENSGKRERVNTKKILRWWPEVELWVRLDLCVREKVCFCYTMESGMGVWHFLGAALTIASVWSTAREHLWHLHDLKNWAGFVGEIAGDDFCWIWTSGRSSFVDCYRMKCRAVHTASVKFNEWHHQPSPDSKPRVSVSTCFCFPQVTEAVNGAVNWNSSGFGPFFIAATLNQHISLSLVSCNSLLSALPKLSRVHTFSHCYHA